MTHAAIPQPGDLLGDYRVIGERGRGGMAVVLELEHTTTGEHRAAKLMLPGRGDHAYAQRLMREHRALSRLDHGNVVTVYEVGEHEGRPYFIMELLDGQVLTDVVDSWQTVPPSERFRRARKVLIAVTRALEHIHARGLVHRDVTPSNIMLLHNGSIKLMDFGVVKEPGDDLTTVGEVIGTIAYIAPEQIRGGPIDARADLYSVGAVFYLMLTGRRPFNARTLAGYMDKHLHREARAPRELVPTIPELADRVCRRLLAKKPADRFSSATHLLHVLHASVPPGPGPDQVGWTPALVGRSAELARVRALLHPLVKLADGAPIEAAQPGAVIVIEGADGMGRNRLAAEVDLLARRHGVLVTRARARGEGDRAFEALRPLYEDLLPEGAAGHPALAATYGSDRAHAGRRVERYAVMKAFADLLATSGPRLLVLHELQRAGQGAIELAEYLVRNLTVTGARPLTLLVTRAVTDSDEGDPLQGILSGATTNLPADRIRLEPISRSAVEELLLAVVADSPLVRPLADRIHREGAGSPFIIAEMVRALVEEGRLAAPTSPGARGRLKMAPQEVREAPLPVPGSLRDALKERLAPLSERDHTVAIALAVSHADLDPSLLAATCDLSEAHVMAGVDALVRARLAHERTVDGQERIGLVRNRVRDVVLEEAAPEITERMHHRLGEALELRHRRNSAAVVESLALHFEAAQVPAKAMPYLIEAARKLNARTFVGEGLALLDRALAIEPEARRYFTLDDADHRRAELQLERAHALSHLGRWQEAQAAVLAADALARDLGDRNLQARTATELAGQARRQLQLAEAQDHLRRALSIAESLGDKRLQIEPLYEYGAIQWTQGDLDAARDYFTQALASSEAYQDERSLALGTNGLGLISLCKGQSAQARRYFEQSMEVCEKHGMMDRLTIARINLIEVHHLTGHLRKGLQLADRTVAHAREVGHRYGIALGLQYRAIVRTDCGRHVDAIDSAGEAWRITRSVGSPDDTVASIAVLIRARMRAGHRDDVLPLIEEALQLVDAVDPDGFGPVLELWRCRVLADLDRRAEALEALEAARQAQSRAWPHQQARQHINLARAHEALGDRRSAVDQAEASLRIADACGYRLYTMRARMMLARLHPDDVIRSRHSRTGTALARSLAAGLPRADAERFLTHQGVKRRARPRLGLVRPDSE